MEPEQDFQNRAGRMRPVDRDGGWCLAPCTEQKAIGLPLAYRKQMVTR